MSIEDNIAASKAADEVWVLAMSEAAAFRGEAALRFWERLARNVFETLPEERRPRQLIKAEIVPANKKLRAFAKKHGHRLVVLSCQSPDGGEMTLECCVTVEDSERVCKMLKEILDLARKTDPDLAKGGEA